MFGALLLNLVLLLSPDPVAGDGAFEARIERGVITSDRDALRQLRDLLRRSPSPAEAATRYNLAYIDWRLRSLLPKREQKDSAREAERQLEALLEERPNDPEALSLLGAVYGAQITGMLSGMRLGPKAGKLLERARELAPSNPRVALQRGISAFHKPKSFGGGLDSAEVALRRAIKLFDREKADKPWPNWGRADAHAWLGQVLAKKGDADGAKAAYGKGLELEPNFRWIREQLLPALEDK